MESSVSLANQFLIAMPAMQDPNFSQTVTLICQHNAEGALGIVINRTVNLTVGDVLDQMQIPKDEFVDPFAPVHYGGPVQTERGFILHEDLGNWDSTLPVTNASGLTTSRDILEAIAQRKGPEKFMVILGFSGWSAGQTGDAGKNPPGRAARAPPPRVP